jgi:hypothetical protein
MTLQRAVGTKEHTEDTISGFTSTGGDVKTYGHISFRAHPVLVTFKNDLNFYRGLRFFFFFLSLFSSSHNHNV